MLSSEQVQYYRQKYNINNQSAPIQSERMQRLQAVVEKNKPEQSDAVNNSKVEEQKSFGNKVGDFFKGALNFGQSILNPTVKALETGIYQPIREVQKVVPGGMTGKEEIETPFGTIKDVKDQSKGESALQALDVASLVVPFEKILAPAFKFVGGASKRLAGALGGKGTAAIDEIIKNPFPALRGLKENSVETLTNLATKARNEIIQMDKAASQAYSQALEELPKRLGRKPSIIESGAKTTIKADGKTYTLSMQGAKKFITEQLRDVGVVVDRAKNNLDFLETPLRKSEENILREAFDVINKWKDTTPKGLNNLAVKIGNYTKAGEQSKLLNGILSGLKNDIRNYIGKRVPAVQELNSVFARQSEIIDNLRDIFSVKNNLKDEKTLRKVASKIQNLFTSNKDLERTAISKYLSEGDNFIATEAGRELAEAPSRASVSIGDSIKAIVNAVIPPKAIGEISAYTGIATEKIKPFVEILNQLAPLERSAIFNAISELFSSDTQTDQEK